MNKLKVALIYSENNFVGPEYFDYLSKHRMAPDLLISVGKFTEEQIEFEICRTGGLWKKKTIPSDQKIFKYQSCHDEAMWNLISDNGIDIIIQAGGGFIYTNDMIASTNIGVINVHPGKLPEYRGCSVPEWAIYNKDDVIITAHMIDEGIDTGPVITYLKYDFCKSKSYVEFRAKLYEACAKVLVNALKLIEISSLDKIIKVQDERKARYWKSIDDSKLDEVKNMFLHNTI